MSRLDPLTATTFDLLIVGGGINGAGLAREAALHGLRVALVEANDYGWGTTWRSTKLIHGGLRYLQHLEIGLVREALRERGRLTRMAPHLVRPLDFVVPVYHDGRRPPWQVSVGLTLYDLLVLPGKDFRRHRRVTEQELMRLAPATRRDGLRAAFRYQDARCDFPERLCWENVRDACALGATALNHVRVERLLIASGRVVGAAISDRLDGGTAEARAAVVVNAAGPWADAVVAGGRRLVGGTRGTHLVADLGPGAPGVALYAEAFRDGRPFFVVPWRGAWLIGTTDVVHEKSPDDLLPEPWEVEYLWEATRWLLPGLQTGPECVRYAYAGVRPLPSATGREAGAITRRHQVVDHSADGIEGCFSLVGGKLGTFRSLAEEATRIVLGRLGRPRHPAHSERRPLAGRAPARLRSGPYGVYGHRAPLAARLEGEAEGLAAPLCPHTAATGAMVLYAARHEQARTLADALLRRTPAAWASCNGRDAALGAARIMAREIGWDEREIERQRAWYAGEVARAFRSAPDLPTGATR